MQQTITTNGGIQQLIKANYQRMMAFEQAAFICNDTTMRSFFTDRADESEAHLKELYAYLNLSDAEGEQCATEDNGAAANKLFQIIAGKRNSLAILDSVKLIEKTICVWYQNFIADIKSLPKGLVDLINKQYHAVGKSQLQLQVL